MKHILTIALLVCAFAMPERARSNELQIFNDICEGDHPSIEPAFCFGNLRGIVVMRTMNCGAIASMYERASSPGERARLKELATLIGSFSAGNTEGDWFKAYKKWFGNFTKGSIRDDARLYVPDPFRGDHFMDAWPCNLEEVLDLTK